MTEVFRIAITAIAAVAPVIAAARFHAVCRVEEISQSRVIE